MDEDRSGGGPAGGAETWGKKDEVASGGGPAGGAETWGKKDEVAGGEETSRRRCDMRAEG